MTKYIIADIDGTLANIDHRLHFLADGKRDYDGFFGAMGDDLCVGTIADLVNDLCVCCGFQIILVSGRPENYRDFTEQWLERHNIDYNELLMRPAGDFRSDVIIKREILHELKERGIFDDIEFVIDDRQRVVDMWREEGLTCLQCAPGDFDDKKAKYEPGVLNMLIGPSGAGKSHYAMNKFLWGHLIVSSDAIRSQICTDFKDQSKNNQVFAALHAIVKTRIENGLETVIDATNLRNRDRRAIRDLVPENTKIVYHVLDRPLEKKLRDGGWRLDVDIKGQNLIERHAEIFKANLKDILAGDNDPRVEVIDLRK